MKKIVIIFSLLCFLCGAIHSQSIPQFKNGDRIAFVGNSITCGGHYHSYIWLYYMTHFPDRRIEIFNEGVGGDVSSAIAKRLDKVFEHDPTIVTLSFGMNDSGYMDFTKPENQAKGEKNVKESEKSYKEIEEEYAKHSKVNKILIGSSPYDETSKFNEVPFPGKNRYILEISDFLKNRANAMGWSFVDLNRPMTSINIREQQKDSTFTLCGGDRVHPANNGQLVMAYLFLKAQGLAGQPVADILIDASAKSVKRHLNCKISNLSVNKSDSISFIYDANSLPYPIDKGYYNGEKYSQNDALNVIPFMDEMNYEGLSVSGLENGYYMLKIDGKAICRVTARDLSRGINMACYDQTPQNIQAQQVRQLNEQRWLMEREMREYFWIEYNLMRDKDLLWESNQAAVDTLLKYRKVNPFVNMLKDYWLRFMYKDVREDNIKEQNEITDKIYDINKPKSRRIDLIKIF
jgi:lysophospholipase L1-like esterase